MAQLKLLIVFVLFTSFRHCLADEDKLPPPAFKAALVCFNGKDGYGSNCRIEMARDQGGTIIATSTLRCGFKGAVSEITWTYRGQKEGKDLYHLVRKFPWDTDDAKITEADVAFDGKRRVVFEDQSQCIVIELQVERPKK